jgi:hypothetical protein
MSTDEVDSRQVGFLCICRKVCYNGMRWIMDRAEYPKMSDSFSEKVYSLGKALAGIVLLVFGLACFLFAAINLAKDASLAVVYFPLYPAHNRLDESRYIPLLACAYVPLILFSLGALGAGWRLVRPGKKSQEPTPFRIVTSVQDRSS